jgi:hypothetical protein
LILAASVAGFMLTVSPFSKGGAGGSVLTLSGDFPPLRDEELGMTIPFALSYFKIDKPTCSLITFV